VTSKESENKKHGDLQRLSLGEFAQNEVAIYGTTCEAIELLVHRIAKLLPEIKLAYADQDHSPEQISESNIIHWQKSGEVVNISSRTNENKYQRNTDLAQADLTIVNGNHFQANAQWVVCDASKENSLKKRAAQLTNVKAILFTDDQQTVPGYVKELVSDWSKIPVFFLSQDHSIIELFLSYVADRPTLKALILLGGKSSRMGEDKATLVYHKMPQYLHLAEMFSNLGIPAFLSCRNDQLSTYSQSDLNLIEDTFLNLGPMSGILSAFRSDPKSAWLVVACDLPLLDTAVIEELLEQRLTNAVATAFISPSDNWPEPLISIWEPKSYPIALSFLSLGYSCPRKVLINSDVHLVECSQPEKLVNVNTPEERKRLNK
jgi:molybdenum cofactor guanylyltransferase